MKTFEENLREQIKKICTHRGDEGKGYYIFSDKQFDLMFEHIKIALETQLKFSAIGIVEKSFDDPKYGIIVKISDVIKGK